MHNLVLLSSALAPLVATSPLLQDLTPSTNLTNPSNLQWDPLIPWGPDELSVDAGRGTVPIPRDAIFVSAIRFIAEQAAEDFNGRLPRPNVVFHDPNYPSVSIAVSSPTPIRIVQRRYVLWGMARVLNHMIGHDVFKSSIWTLRWRNFVVGRILFVAGGRNALDAGFGDVEIMQPRLEMPSSLQISNSTALSAGEGSNAIHYDFEFYGDELVKHDVFMGTLGGLIQVAQHSSHAFGFWVGSFPGYRCFHTYITSVHPSVMTKNLVIVTMVAGMAHALRENNWRELRLTVLRDGEEILRGGYIDHPMPPGQQGLSSS